MSTAIIWGTVQRRKTPFVQAFLYSPPLFTRYAAIGESSIVSASGQLELHFPVGKAPETEEGRYSRQELERIHNVLGLFQKSRTPHEDVKLKCYRHAIIASSSRWINLHDVDFDYFPESYAILSVDSKEPIAQQTSTWTGLPVGYIEQVIGLLK